MCSMKTLDKEGEWCLTAFHCCNKDPEKGRVYFCSNQGRNLKAKLGKGLL